MSNANVAPYDGNVMEVEKISVRDAIVIATMTSTFLICVFMHVDCLSGLITRSIQGSSVLAHCITQLYEDTYILVPKDFTIMSDHFGLKESIIYKVLCLG